MAHELEEGVCARLAAATRNDSVLFTTPHVLQVLSVKKITDTDRFRVILSDGKHFTQAMLAFQLNHLVHDHTLNKHTIIRTDGMSCRFVQDKRLLILMSLSVVGQSEEKIGEPTVIASVPTMAHELEEGVCTRLAAVTPNDDVLLTIPHVLQVLSVKKITDTDRFRVILSDGKYFTQAMLATQLNHLVHDHTLDRHTIIRTDGMFYHFVQDKRLLILMSLSVVGQSEEKIGEPTAIASVPTMAHELEEGVCTRLAAATPNDDVLLTTPHVLQVLSIKKLIGSSSTDRFRVILSDGKYFTQAMLATQLNHLVHDHTLDKHTIIRTNGMSCHFVRDNRLLILMSLSVVGQSEERIGEPTMADELEDICARLAAVSFPGGRSLRHLT
ncbi:hypothetical protein D9758_008221 [Tetrapyrgos nigripes]|uniref:Replication factor-A protein 1 N-terminal domain-containing protein n=1 Tax=Tetrapyrgos nigripes TaxID=182062 RepID=A0A8H5G1D1_9AGAR|nr:hypothetical protein D9758_008221 [Tetrapyrgos nigripes]